MSCWCGHGPWHHQGHVYPSPYPPPHYPPPQYPPPQYPPPAYYPPGEPYERPRRRRPRGRDPEELQEYLQDLREEIDRVSDELAAMRESDEAES